MAMQQQACRAFSDEGVNGDAARDARQDLVARISTQRGLWRSVE